jgi:TRAP-type C4-dicarboxylate transport system permease small subunit
LLAWLAGIIILAIVAVSINEIILRNAFTAPTTWGSEVVELMVLYVFLMPMAFAQLDEGMIRITFFVEKLPRKVYGTLKLIASFSSVVFGLLLFKASYLFFLATVPGSNFPETSFPAQVQRGVVPLCALLLALAGAICVIRDALTLVSGKVSPKTEE